MIIKYVKSLNYIEFYYNIKVKCKIVLHFIKNSIRSRYSNLILKLF